MNVPQIPYIIERLRKHKEKQSYSDAQLAADLNSFATAYGWTETQIAALMKGTRKPTDSQIEMFELYLQKRFYDYNCT